MILIRNVLHVPADLDKEKRPENDASVHDQVSLSFSCYKFKIDAHCYIIKQ